MKSSLSKISIILPTYNRTKYIRKSIESCLNQTYKNIELIIVNDGSIDETSEIINSYRDRRIRSFIHIKNKGLPYALNTGFAHAEGDYLTWTSDDNYYAQNAIEKMLIFLKIKKGDFVYCDYYGIDLCKPSFSKVNKLSDVLHLKEGNQVGPCFLYSRKLKEIIGNYDSETELVEDYDYWIRISKKFPMYHLNEPLYFFSFHDESLFAKKYYEIKMMDFLVRLKNDILDVKQVSDLFRKLILEKKKKFDRLTKVFTKILVFKKITPILKDFKERKSKFEDVKIRLKNIIERINS